MKVHILDDWFDTLKTLPSYAKLAGHDVTVWTDHVEDHDVLARRLAGAEALVLFRERTAIPGALLTPLAEAGLISQRLGLSAMWECRACSAERAALSSNMNGRRAVRGGGGS